MSPNFPKPAPISRENAARQRLKATGIGAARSAATSNAIRASLSSSVSETSMNMALRSDRYRTGPFIEVVRKRGD